MTITCSELQREIVDREAIRHCLMRYCRAIDRMDKNLLLSVYWPDAVDHHLEFTGSPGEFVEYSFAVMKQMDQTMHTLGNILIAIDGPQAQTESYFHAFHRLGASDEHPARDIVVGGRYLDRFEKRHDEWRIIHRTVVIDWFRNHEDSADWSAGLLGMQISPGGRKPDDPSYQLMDLL